MICNMFHDMFVHKPGLRRAQDDDEAQGFCLWQGLTKFVSRYVSRYVCSLVRTSTGKGTRRQLIMGLAFVPGPFHQLKPEKGQENLLQVVAFFIAVVAGDEES